LIKWIIEETSIREIILKYKKVTGGRFLSRPNRFIAVCEIDGAIETVHVKNTGRLKELLVPGTPAYLEYSDKPERKTRYSLVTVEKVKWLVNIDSNAPNRVVADALKTGVLKLPGMPVLDHIKPEHGYGKSRFDLYLEGGGMKAFMEIKGVTLEKDGIAMFPDAPTLRGEKHVHELIAAREEGYQAYILFLIQMKGISFFTPNDEMHRAFGDAVRLAAENGVHVLAYDCHVEPDSLTIADPVEVVL